MTNTAQHRARKHWWAALDDHSQGMWVRPNVCGLFSQNEGHINRLKMLKRQMFGRATLDLLLQRFLLAA